MKIKEKIDVKKVIVKSEKNQKKLSKLFDKLEEKDLSKKGKKEINAQLENLENLVLSLKEKLA